MRGCCFHHHNCEVVILKLYSAPSADGRSPDYQVCYCGNDGSNRRSQSRRSLSSIVELERERTSNNLSDCYAHTPKSAATGGTAQALTVTHTLQSLSSFSLPLQLSANCSGCPSRLRDLRNQSTSATGRCQTLSRHLRSVKLRLSDTMVPMPAAKDQFYRTKLCPHFEAGNCRKKSECFFAHGAQELRHTPDLRKTKLCQEFIKTGNCTRGESCMYAHSEKELRYTDGYWKTELCKYWKQGGCTAGHYCRHAHGPEDLRPKKFDVAKTMKTTEASSRKLGLNGVSSVGGSGVGQQTQEPVDCASGNNGRLRKGKAAGGKKRGTGGDAAPAGSLSARHNSNQNARHWERRCGSLPEDFENMKTFGGLKQVEEERKTTMETVNSMNAQTVGPAEALLKPVAALKDESILPPGGIASLDEVTRTAAVANGGENKCVFCEASESSNQRHPKILFMSEEEAGEAGEIEFGGCGVAQQSMPTVAHSYIYGRQLHLSMPGQAAGLGSAVCAVQQLLKEHREDDMLVHADDCLESFSEVDHGSPVSSSMCISSAVPAGSLSKPCVYHAPYLHTAAASSSQAASQMSPPIFRERHHFAGSSSLSSSVFPVSDVHEMVTSSSAASLDLSTEESMICPASTPLPLPHSASDSSSHAHHQRQSATSVAPVPQARRSSLALPSCSSMSKKSRVAMRLPFIPPPPKSTPPPPPPQRKPPPPPLSANCLIPPPPPPPALSDASRSATPKPGASTDPQDVLSPTITTVSRSTTCSPLSISRADSISAASSSPDIATALLRRTSHVLSCVAHGETHLANHSTPTPTVSSTVPSSPTSSFASPPASCSHPLLPGSPSEKLLNNGSTITAPPLRLPVPAEGSAEVATPPTTEDCCQSVWCDAATMMLCPTGAVPPNKSGPGSGGRPQFPCFVGANSSDVPGACSSFQCCPVDAYQQPQRCFENATSCSSVDDADSIKCCSTTLEPLSQLSLDPQEDYERGARRPAAGVVTAEEKGSLVHPLLVGAQSTNPPPPVTCVQPVVYVPVPSCGPTIPSLQPYSYCSLPDNGAYILNPLISAPGPYSGAGERLHWCYKTSGVPLGLQALFSGIPAEALLHGTHSVTYEE